MTVISSIFFLFSKKLDLMKKKNFFFTSGNNSNDDNKCETKNEPNIGNWLFYLKIIVCFADSVWVISILGCSLCHFSCAVFFIEWNKMTKWIWHWNRLIWNRLLRFIHNYSLYHAYYCCCRCCCSLLLFIYFLFIR